MAAHAHTHQTLLGTDPRTLIEQFLRECSAVGVADVNVIRRIAQQTIVHLRGTPISREVTELEQALQLRWYDSLAAGKADYGVYATDYYLGEMWACWSVYSRKYLTGILQPKSLPPYGILGHLGTVRRVVDLGCGIGFTTAALREIFPHADVGATNLNGTAQAEVARRMAKQFGFRLSETVEAFKGPTDLVFASEYFEHIESPLDHLEEVLTTLTPRTLLVANSFGTRAIGHFNHYLVAGQPMPGHALSRMFNAALRHHGYRKMKTAMWNQRPAYWVRQ